MVNSQIPPFLLLLLLLLTVTFFTPPPPTVHAFPPPTNAFVAPVDRDAATSLYTIPITSNNASSFVLDLAGPIVWSSPCPEGHPTVPCNSTTCAAARSFPPPHCPRVTPLNRHPCACTAYSVNPVTGECGFGEVTLADAVLSSTDGKNPTAVVHVSDLASSCAPTSLLRALPSGAIGVAGLARAGLALPSQLASKFYFQKRFALCLPSTGSTPGVAFFGNGSFYLLPPPGIDVTALLKYTPLLNNPRSPAYYIDVKGLAVNEQAVQLPAGKLELDDASGHGGVKISTAVPYTALRSDIYQPFLSAFAGATSGIPRMPNVKPFDLCMNSSALSSTRVGYAVPQIDVVLVGGQNWTIFGANSMVDVGQNTACFAFVDAGPKAEQAAVVGGFQMENSLMVFDEERSRLGYTSTLFGIRTTCGNFNFTMAA